MNQVLQVSIVVHILSGAIALSAGVLALLFAKGSKGHKRSGIIFWLSMNVVGVSALVLSFFNSNQFLTWIGIFCLFMNYFGRRAVQTKLMQASPVDWICLAVGWYAAIGMLISLNTILMVFGLLCLLLCLRQTRVYYHVKLRRVLPNMTWLQQHISFMMGSFIGTFTAFLVVNSNGIEPAWLIWILPSLAGTSLIIYYQRKVNSMSARAAGILIITLGNFGSWNTRAQVYVEGGNTRHRFAQMNLGIDTRLYTSNQTRLYRVNSDGSLAVSDADPQSELRLIIGGTHFWGHADFYVAFPIAHFNTTGFKPDVETGARYFPWRIENKKMRPFLGASFLATSYTYQDAARKLKFRYPLSAGLVFNSGAHLFEFSAGYYFNFTENYHYTLTQSATIDLHHTYVSVGYKFMFETTLSAEENWKNGNTEKWTTHLASEKKLNGITIAAGPSSCFFTKKSGYNEHEFPFLDEHKSGKVFGDFGIGYYWHKPDIQINLGWRANQSTQEAFGYIQTIKRKSAVLEAFKIFTDYHGFAAFAGPCLSYEWLSLNMSYQGSEMVHDRYNGLKAGIIFGWDIRPDRIQRFILRTNLRYFPSLYISTSSGRRFSMDQLEFNFIQLVVYPGRFF